MAAQMPDSKCYRQLSDFPFVFVSGDSVSAPPLITDSLFDAASRGIRFRVNSTQLQADDSFVRIYREQIVPYLRSNDMQLRQVFVKGAASPEGSYQNNVRLSRLRTQRLIAFLSEELGQPLDAAQPIDAKSITEDYGRLVAMMAEAADKDADRVANVWQQCQGDEACCKQQLMALDGGRLWQRLKQQYFPALREARGILWFAQKHIHRLQPVAITHDATFAQPQLPQQIDLPLAEQPQAPQRYTRRHLIAARTNLVHDLLYVPQFGWAYGGNIQLEYYPLRGHYTMNAGFTFTNHRHWQDYKFFQLRDAQLELRRYFRGGGIFRGPYLGVYGEYTVYGIGFSKQKGWEGEGGGGGLTLGWVWRLNKKGNLRIEASASLGLFITRYDPYVYGNPFSGKEDGLYYYEYYGNADQFQERNHRFTWFGPTNAGLHLTYDIIYRKRKPAPPPSRPGGIP